MVIFVESTLIFRQDLIKKNPEFGYKDIFHMSQIYFGSVIFQVFDLFVNARVTSASFKSEEKIELSMQNFMHS